MTTINWPNVTVISDGGIASLSSSGGDNSLIKTSSDSGAQLRGVSAGSLITITSASNYIEISSSYQNSSTLDSRSSNYSFTIPDDLNYYYSVFMDGDITGQIFMPNNPFYGQVVEVALAKGSYENSSLILTGTDGFLLIGEGGEFVSHITMSNNGSVYGMIYSELDGDAPYWVLRRKDQLPLVLEDPQVGPSGRVDITSGSNSYIFHVDTSDTNPITVHLPETFFPGNYITVIDTAGSASLKNITITSSNGIYFNGSPDTITIEKDFGSANIVMLGGDFETQKWIVQSIDSTPDETELPSGSIGSQLMHNNSGWTTGSLLSKYIVGPDPTDRYSTIQSAVAAAVADGVGAAPGVMAVVYVKPKIGTYNTYSVGSLVMPPNIAIQGLSHGMFNGMPGCFIDGNITFPSASSYNLLSNVSIRAGSGNVISITGNSARVDIMSCDIIGSGTATPLNINGSSANFYMGNGSLIQSLGNQPCIQNAAGFFSAYGGIIQQDGTSIISYNNTGAYTSAYGSFNNCVLKGELHFTTNGGAEVFNCRHVLGSNSAYPVEFDNAGSGGTKGGIVYKNSAIQYDTGLTGPSGPWINVISGEASVYVGNVVLDETNLRTLNPYTDKISMNIGQVDAENSANWIREVFVSQSNPSNRMILKYDSNGSQPFANWVYEEPITSSNDTTVTLPDDIVYRHLLMSNSGSRSVTLFDSSISPCSITVIDSAGTAGTNSISITGSVGQTIYGSREILSDYGAATFVSSGATSWYRIS